jgi:hypothetical protein
MTRKDYEVLANCLKSLEIRPSVKLLIVEAIAGELAIHYPNFKRQTFIEVAMNMRSEDD